MSFPYLAVGKKLLANQYVYSPSHFLQLWQQNDGNLVLYDYTQGGKPTWHSNTASGPGNFTVLQADGNFVVYNKDGTPLWAAASNRSDFKGVLLVTDDGKILIEDVTTDVTKVAAKQ